MSTIMDNKLEKMCKKISIFQRGIMLGNGDKKICTFKHDVRKIFCYTNNYQIKPKYDLISEGEKSLQKNKINGIENFYPVVELLSLAV
jgi:hypothetical protein